MTSPLERRLPLVPALAAVLAPRALRLRAGARTFSRGEEYFESERVQNLSTADLRATATVQGTEPYAVCLRLANGALQHSCTCPVGEDGDFCKHCVAVALAWAHSALPEHAQAEPRVTPADVRAWLAARPHDALVDLVMELAGADPQVHERLLRAVARSGPQGPDFATYRKAFDAAIRVRGFVDYRSAGPYVRRVDAAVDGLDELLADGHAVEVIQLAERALAAVERALGNVDDSDGGLGGVLRRLGDIHLAACRKARPEPEGLARRLFAWELKGEWDTFLGASEAYAEVLGEKGLRVYRALAEVEWTAVPERGPGEDRAQDFCAHFRITHIMETLARQSGDIDALVAVKRKDLSSAWRFLQIAEACAQAQRHDQALEWAQRGLQAFPQRTDSRLREFLAKEYHRRGRHEDAMVQAWAQFEDAPSLDRYQALKQHADRVQAWPAWRDMALALLRRAAQPQGPADVGPPWPARVACDRSDLIRVLLWEGHAQEAWREALEGGCDEGLWLALAAAREREHPADAARIYQARLEPTLDGRNERAYRTAVEMLRKVRGLLLRLGREDEFLAFVRTVRSAHKAKRNFIKLLDRERWGTAGGG